MKDVLLHARGIVKTYHRDSPAPIHAIRGVDVTLYRGEFVALMGRSGSGKSTLLHQLALLDTPTEGTIVIAGRTVDELTERQKAYFRLSYIGYVFQDYALADELTVFENVALPLMALGQRNESIYTQVMDVLKKLGLENVHAHLPGELSGGQKQRAAIARAIVNKPAILFADEPTANLDTESSRQVLTAFSELNKKHGQTILMVTHEPEDKKYVRRILEMRDGLLISQ